MSILSNKARIRAEKRAAVLAEAAEWEEIRTRESKSKSRTSSPPQASTTIQGGEMPPPAAPASMSGRNELTKSNSKNTDPSTNNLSESTINSDETARPAKPTSASRVTTVSPPVNKPLAAAALPVNVTNSNILNLSGAQPSQPRSSRSSSATLARGGTPSTSSTKRPVNQARIPRLVPNLTKSMSPIVGKARKPVPVSALNPTSHRSPGAAQTFFTAETCADSQRLLIREKKIVAQMAYSTTSSPCVANSVQHTQNVAVDIDTPIVSVVPRPASEDLALSCPPCSTSGPSPSSPLPGGTDVQSSAVSAVVQQPRAAPSSARIPVTLNHDCTASTRSVLPSDERTRSSRIDMGVAAAMGKTSAAQTADFLKQASRDASSIGTAPDKKEEIAAEASKSTTDERLPRRLGAYAHVPEPDPFSAKPSENEIAAIQQLSYGIRRRAIAPIKQERSIVKFAFRSAGTKTLELLIEPANGEMNSTLDSLSIPS
ncbi:hypothetical protein IFR05_016606 [Cadophora sp. M221]|nr:hypothetical protein IFR05_016606 [Cadophora sp. M221]